MKEDTVKLSDALEGYNDVNFRACHRWLRFRVETEHEPMALPELVSRTQHVYQELELRQVNRVKASFWHRYVMALPFSEVERLLASLGG